MRLRAGRPSLPAPSLAALALSLGGPGLRAGRPAHVFRPVRQHSVCLLYNIGAPKLGLTALGASGYGSATVPSAQGSTLKFWPVWSYLAGTPWGHARAKPEDVFTLVQVVVSASALSLSARRCDTVRAPRGTIPLFGVCRTPCFTRVCSLVHGEEEAH